MTFEVRSFQTKVAKRIFILFIACAFIPVSAFALFSYLQVKNQLTEQSLNRLQKECKSIAVSVYERLVLIRSQMSSVVLTYRERKIQGNSIPDGTLQLLTNRFNAMTILTDDKEIFLLGRFTGWPAITPDQQAHLASGNALLRQFSRNETESVLVMYLLLDRSHPEQGVLAAEIKDAFLWEASDRMPPMTEVSVLDRTNRILHSSLDGPVELPQNRFEEIKQSHSGRFQWQGGSTPYVSYFTTLFLAPNFFYPEWIILLSEPTPYILASMTGFKVIFPALIIFTLGMVFFLSQSLIRKNLVPIETLEDATRKISDGAFGHTVEIKSGDEFEALGASFNEMSQKLRDGELLLVRSAKMAAIGQMASGIVHEIKQPLSSMYGYIQLALMDAKEEKDRENLQPVLTALNRLDNIVARFNSFSKREAGEFSGVVLSEVIQEVYTLIQHQLLKYDIDCLIDTEVDLPKIIGDSTGIQQVYSNLIINAMHAVEDKPAGDRSIRIHTYCSGQSVISVVEDNGYGIPDDIIDKIFDPFFTTKDSEKGTGLGMSIVESILHKHDAAISVESRIGEGTKFTITLPAFDEERML